MSRECVCDDQCIIQCFTTDKFHKVINRPAKYRCPFMELELVQFPEPRNAKILVQDCLHQLSVEMV